MNILLVTINIFSSKILLLMILAVDQNELLIVIYILYSTKLPIVYLSYNK